MAREVLVAPPAALMVKDILRARGVNHPVYTTLPEQLPAAVFVQVIRLGSRSPNLITDTPRLLVKVYGAAGASDLDTEREALHVQGLLAASPGTIYPSGKVRGFNSLGGLASVPDTDAHRTRYQLVCELSLRARAD